MARYGVQVIGRGGQCFVVANLPGEGGYRRGPMPEDEAVALAEEMAAELRGLAQPKPVVTDDARRTMAVLVAIMVALVMVVWLVLR